MGSPSQGYHHFRRLGPICHTSREVFGAKHLKLRQKLPISKLPIDSAMSLFLRFKPPLSGCQSPPGLLHFEEILTTKPLITYGILGGISRSKLFQCFSISVGRYLFLPYQIPHPSLAQVFRLWPFLLLVVIHFTPLPKKKKNGWK